MSAQNNPAPKPLPRRVNIQVSLLKPSLDFGDTAASTILVVTDEDVETYVAFKQVNTLKGYDPQTKRDIPIPQAIGPSLRVTPRIEANGQITLYTEVQFEEATPGAAPGMASGTTVRGVKVRQTVESGQAVMLDDLIKVKGVKPQIRLTATILKPQERASPVAA